jgi:hypothetical protein
MVKPCGPMKKRFRSAFCGHEDGGFGDHYETPTLEDMAEELKKSPDTSWTDRQRHFVLPYRPTARSVGARLREAHKGR